MIRVEESSSDTKNIRLTRKVQENPVYSGQIWWREFGWRDVHLLLTGGCTQILTFLTTCIQISPNLHWLRIRFFDNCVHINKSDQKVTLRQSWLRDGIFRDPQSQIPIPGIRDRDVLFWARSKNPEIPGIGIWESRKNPE